MHTTATPPPAKPPVLPLPALASIPVAPPLVETEPEPEPAHEPGAPSLDEALAAEARAHERASTGSYALGDETLPMPIVDLATPPTRPRPRFALGMLVGVLAAVATASVVYVALAHDDAAVAATSSAPTPREPSSPNGGRVSIPVASKPSTPASAPAPAPSIDAHPAPVATSVPPPPPAVTPATPVVPRERRAARARPPVLEQLPPPPLADAAAAAPKDDLEREPEPPSEPAPLEDPPAPTGAP